MSRRLENKTVLLTGAAQGIGAAIARLFVAEGATVALVDRQPEPLLTLAEELGTAALPWVVDITDTDAVKEVVAQILKQWSHLDILVNNAGIVRDALTAKMSREQWDSVLDVNLTAPFVCTQAVIPAMQSQGQGVILNAASVSALGNVGQANYAASKAAIIALTKTWALELARYQIRVNAVAPGFTQTPMIGSVPEKILTKMCEKTPLGRLAQPQDIANAYCFLASPEASFITGQVLYVDGGLTCGF